MAKVTYTLTAGDDLVRVDVIDGKTVLVFETEAYDDESFETADSSGDRQSDMLWEIFEHSFEVTDEDGNIIKYHEDLGDRIS